MRLKKQFSVDAAERAQLFIMSYFYLLFTVLFFYSFQAEAQVRTVDLRENSQQAQLLDFLKTLPGDLNINSPEHLAAVETYIQRAESGFDIDIVIDFQNTIHSSVVLTGNSRVGAESLLKLYNTFSDEMNAEQQHWALIIIATSHNASNNHDKAQELLTGILPEIENRFHLGRAYAELGTSNSRTGRHEIAVENYLEAISLYRQGDHVKQIAEVYNRLGMLYYSLEDYEMSVSYYQRHIARAEENGDPLMLGNGYINIGAAYRQAGDPEKALDFYRKGLEISEEIGRIQDVARAAMNIGNIYAEKGEVDEALSYYGQSLEISQQLGLEYGIMINQYNIGNLYFEQGQYGQSEEAFLTAYDLMDRQNHIYDFRLVTNRLGRLYEIIGNFEKSVYFLKIYMEINAEIFDAERLRITEDLRATYETERKEQEIALANTLLQQKSIENRFLFLLAIFLAAALLAGFVYYRKRNEYLKLLYQRNVEILHSSGHQVISTPYKAILQPDTRKESENWNKLYEKVTKLFIEEKMYRNPNIRLDKLAVKAGSNRKYVSEAISSSTGMNFNNFVNFYRVNEAKVLIIAGEDSMSEVQYQCGFNSRSTFYTAFKHFTGMSPTEFQKMNRVQSSEAAKAQGH